MTDELVIPRGITRHDYDRAKGWFARVPRTVDGAKKCVRRLFSDGVYGGELEALAAAVAWHREQKQGEPPRERKRLPGYGYVQRGVRRYWAASGELRSYPAFLAWFWDDAGHPRSTSWSILEHGEAEAEARCQAWLENERAELGIREPLAQAG